MSLDAEIIGKNGFILSTISNKQIQMLYLFGRIKPGLLDPVIQALNRLNLNDG